MSDVCVCVILFEKDIILLKLCSILERFHSILKSQQMDSEPDFNKKTIKSFSVPI
jgi:hypothetical protein